VLKELTGHYVNFRKQCSPKGKPLLPETDFRLYAVCSRYPHNLANDVALEPVGTGVYACRRGTDVIRIIVASQVPRQEHNALLHLFSASAARIDYGTSHYQQHSSETSTVLEQLLVEYRGEGIAMAYTMADWRRDYDRELLKRMTPEELRQALQGLSPEKVLEALSPEQLRDALRGLSPEARLEGLSPEEIEQVLQKRQAERPARSKKPRRRG